MKKIVLLLSAVTLFIACNNTPTTEPTKGSADQTSYAYTVDNPPEWQWGDEENTRTAMKALKAFEQGNVDESIKYFADSITLKLDGFEATGPRDSIALILKKGLSHYNNLKIKMEDYESVKSKDGKSEYVSLWYKQNWTDSTGKLDSIECFNDFKMVNGKIAVLNEKIRHFAAKKM